MFKTVGIGYFDIRISYFFSCSIPPFQEHIYQNGCPSSSFRGNSNLNTNDSDPFAHAGKPQARFFSHLRRVESYDVILQGRKDSLHLGFLRHQRNPARLRSEGACHRDDIANIPFEDHSRGSGPFLCLLQLSGSTLEYRASDNGYFGECVIASTQNKRQRTWIHRYHEVRLFSRILIVQEPARGSHVFEPLETRGVHTRAPGNERSPYIRRKARCHMWSRTR